MFQRMWPQSQLTALGERVVEEGEGCKLAILIPSRPAFIFTVAVIDNGLMVPWSFAEVLIVELNL